MVAFVEEFEEKQVCGGYVLNERGRGRMKQQKSTFGG